MQSVIFTTAAIWAVDAPGGGLAQLLVTFGLPMLFLFYFMVWRPQQKERKQRLAMLAGLKKNDRVVTVGGMYGVVANVRPEADEVTLKVDETTNTKIRVTLSSIQRVLGEAAGDTPPAK